MKTPMFVLLTLVLLVFSSNSLLFAEAPAAVDQWLVAGPFACPNPVFGDSTASPLKADDIELSRLRPVEGDAINLYPGISVPWQKHVSAELALGSSGANAITWAASYLNFARAQKIELRIESVGSRDLEVYLDGTLQSGDPGKEQNKSSLTIKSLIHHGKHLLLVKAANSADAKSWSLRATVQSEDSAVAAAVNCSTDPRRALTEFADAALFDGVSSPILSADGKWLVTVGSQREHDGDFKKESWVAIWNAQSRKLVQTILPLKGPDPIAFIGSSATFCYTTAGDKGSTIWSYNVVNGDSKLLLKDIEGLVRVVISPDGKFIYYSADAEKKSKKNDSDPDYYAKLEDRMSDWTDTRSLYVCAIESGAVREVTSTGEFALDDFALSREGDQLLFTRRLTKAGRPFYSTEFWTYAVAAGDAKKISTQAIAFETRPASFCWLPGGETMAYVAARYTTEAGDTVHNMTQTDLFLLNVKTGAVRSLSKAEVFSVQESEGRSAVVWNAAEKKLWMQVVEGGKVRLKRVDPNSTDPKFSNVSISLPFVDDFALSANGQCVFTGSDPLTPAALYLTDGRSKESQISNPAAKILPQIQLAKYEPWSFTNQDGIPIEGYLFYPTDYKPELSRSWPMVVYYYGGVSPRDERFTFTYHWWAANGYFVYVLNPVGCVGYGEAFADKHSNDWGTLASRDIIEGTQKLVKEKPFIDSKMLGCYGGSYGGFITMDVVTKTDLFAAAVSDAGISNLSSYFGAGTWGFTYGDIALPGSYPWNRPELFVEKSPVFHADKIHTPLLLIHGSADDNVPPTESDQMFVALKLLGRETALLRYPDEDHSIAIKYTDYIHYREMMLEWFDKWVKKEGIGWDERAKELKN